MSRPPISPAPFGLKPGVYKLARDVPAPLSDRRVKHDWRYARCETGTLYLVRDDAHENLCAERLGGYAHMRLVCTDIAAYALCAALERVALDTLTAQQYVAARGFAACEGDVLDRLLRTGGISFADLERCVDALEVGS